MSKKDLSKRKQREERIRIAKHKEAINNLYPKFIFINEQFVDKNLINLVKNACQSVDFENVIQQLPVAVKLYFSNFLKNIVKTNFKIAYFQLMNDIRPKDWTDEHFSNFNGWLSKEANKLVHLMLIIIGDFVLNQNYDKIMQLWPDQGFRLTFVGNQLAVVFQRLVKQQNTNGQQIISPLKGIKVANKKKTIEFQVYFTKHSIERIIDRFNFSKTSNERYSKYVALYEFFVYSKVKFRKSLRDKEPFIQFYFPIELDCFTMTKNICDMPLETLTDIHSNKNPFINSDSTVTKNFNIYTTCLGCPAVINFSERKLICITALVPGYFPTPEHKLLLASKTTDRKLQEKIRHRFYGSVHMKSDEFLEALKFFHENGKNQVFIEQPPNQTNLLSIGQYYEKPSDLPEHHRVD